MASLANIGGAADPRQGSYADDIGTRRESIKSEAPPDTHGHNNVFLDSSIPFEAYHYYAGLAREYEKNLEVPGILSQMGNVVRRNKTETDGNESPVDFPTEKQLEGEGTVAPPSYGASNTEGNYGVTEGEWERAQRQARTATWISIFYLITTDILGPFNVPWAFSQMGYGPGVVLYVVFGAMAAYSGIQLWQQFIGLDSPRYPMRNYGDLAFRLFGNWARLIVNVMQSLQFFLNVTLLTVNAGQSLQQMAAGSDGTGFICFVVAELIFALIGFVLGQIRTLQRLGFLANLAVWLNIFVMIMTMVITNTEGPNYVAVKATFNIDPGQPITTSGYWPPGSNLQDRINGLMNGVFAYGGATLFNELMAEMRRPYDFWKGFVCAEIFIFVVYMIMGLVVYSAQGQYTYNPAYQGIPNSAYAWQTVGNALSFVTLVIAALLYGNIGIKVFYSAVCRDVFGFPPLDSKKGKWTWVFLVPLYWALCFIVAAAIPEISYLISFVGAAFILQFSYTFPPLLMVAFNCQKDSILPEEQFDPIAGRAARVDNGFKRWIRGFRQKWALNSFNSIYFLASLSVAGLGIYASIEGMKDAFSNTNISSFSCQGPTG